MNFHNRVYPPYAFESAEEAAFPSSVDEMADTLEAEVQIYPACFERGQRFRNVDDMANTLTAGIKGAEIHVPQNMIPVLNSIVHTYKKELEELRDYFYTKVRFLEEKVKVLGCQLSPATQMPSVYALP